MISKSARLALLAVVVLALAGCAISAPEAGPPTAPPPPASSPSPTPIETNAASDPILAFGGDCMDVLTDAQVESILGPGARSLEEWLAANSPDWRVGGPERTAGGIECRWMAADGADGLPAGMQEIAVLALPASVVADEYATELSTARCDPQYDTTLCRLGRTVGSVWLMARSGPGTAEPPLEQLESALDAAAANVAAFPEPVPLPRERVWWTLGACDDLGERMSLSEILGTDYHSGYWEGSPQYEDWILEEAGVGQFCQWSSDSADIPEGHEHYILSATLEPGGAWQWSDIVPDDAVAVSLTGAQEAFHEGAAGDYRTGRVWATDGVNVLTVYTEGGDVSEDVAERVLAAVASG